MVEVYSPIKKRKATLIVDDEDDILSLLERFLKNYDVKVVKANNGDQALFKLENEKFDLVFLDYKMPGIDGLSVLESMRNKSKMNSATPVVIVSGYLDKEVIPKFAPYKISGAITKPIEKDKFELLTNKFLKKKQ